MKRIIISLAIVFMIFGCIDIESSGVSELTESPANTEKMELNTLYVVGEGDRIKKASADSRIEIIQNAEENYSKVTLISGSATIIRVD